jgi:hypothetical protein
MKDEAKKEKGLKTLPEFAVERATSELGYRRFGQGEIIFLLKRQLIEELL